MTHAASPDEYLATLAPAQRVALEAVRDTIRSVEPKMTERMSSGAPFFWYRGKRAIGFGAAKTHLSLYITHGAVLKTHRHELAAFDTSTTVIRFTPEQPIPAALVRRLARARLSEISESTVDEAVLRSTSKYSQGTRSQ